MKVKFSKMNFFSKIMTNIDRYEKRFRPRASARKTLVGLRGNLLPQFGKNVV